MAAVAGADLQRVLSIASILASDAQVLVRSVRTDTAYKLFDVPYVAGGHLRQKLDVYIPRTVQFPRPMLPALLFLPGGAWTRGDKDHGAADRPGLAQRL
jgi:acetyl esterase/lipase